MPDVSLPEDAAFEDFANKYLHNVSLAEGNLRAASKSLDLLGGARLAGDLASMNLQREAFTEYALKFSEHALKGAALDQELLELMKSLDISDADIDFSSYENHLQSLQQDGFSTLQLQLMGAAGLSSSEIEQSRQAQLSHPWMPASVYSVVSSRISHELFLAALYSSPEFFLAP
jgi:hypothetical protein